MLLSTEQSGVNIDSRSTEEIRQMLWTDPNFFKYSGEKLSDLSNDNLLCAPMFQKETNLDEYEWICEIYKRIKNGQLKGNEKYMNAPKLVYISGLLLDYNMIDPLQEDENLVKIAKVIGSSSSSV